MATKMDVIAAFRALLETRRDALQRESRSAQAGARVDGVHRPATRGERGAVSAQGALAHGLAERARQVDDALGLLAEVDPGPCDRVQPGALVELEFGGAHIERWILLPGGQGDRVEGVLVLSPTAPAARRLLGQEEGDGTQLRRSGNLVFVEILSVQ